MSWAAVAIGAGSAITAGGGMLSGQATNRAGRSARNFQDRRTSEGYQRLLNEYFGPGAGSAAGWSVPGGVPPTPSSGSILGRLGGLSQWGEQQGQGIQRGYDAGTQRLMGLAGGAEGMAHQWGAGRGNVIRADFAQNLRNANSRGDAALAAAGFNSPTIRSQQYAGNQAQIGREQERALQDLSESQIDRQLGARTQTLNVAGGRESGRTGLQQSLLGQAIGLRNAPISAEQQLAQSAMANPWLGQGTSQFFPGASGLGSSLSNVGGAATAYGGYSLGQQQQQNFLAELLRQQRMSGASGSGTAPPSMSTNINGGQFYG